MANVAYFLYLFRSYYNRTYRTMKEAWSLHILVYVSVCFMCVYFSVCVFVHARICLRIFRGTTEYSMKDIFQEP